MQLAFGTMIRPRAYPSSSAVSAAWNQWRAIARQPRLRSQRIRNPGPFLRYPLRRSHSSVAQSPPHPSFKKPSIFRRVIGFTAIAATSFFVGVISSSEFLKMQTAVTSLPSDKETLQLYTPTDEASQEVENYLNSHPVAQSLRANPEFTESRPHMQYPAELRAHSLTGGTLSGPNKIVVPPYAFSETGGKSFVSVFYIGSDLCGHPGIVHGGLLATLLDEGLARCCFPALPNKVGVTANLNIDYRRPAPAGSYFALRATTTKVEGRKAWVEGRIETLPKNGEEPVVLVEAKALFVEPKNAALMPRLYRVAES